MTSVSTVTPRKRWKTLFISSGIGVVTLFASIPMNAYAADIWLSDDDDLASRQRILIVCNKPKMPIDLDWPEFDDRDLIVIRNPTSHAFRSPDSFSKRVEKRRFCQDIAEFVLIGKDGWEKKRWQNELPIQDLFETIDAMPMRRLELETRGEH